MISWKIKHVHRDVIAATVRFKGERTVWMQVSENNRSDNIAGALHLLDAIYFNAKINPRYVNTIAIKTTVARENVTERI